jgi:uncharacterized peroxidase-related enzyme
VRAVLSDWRTAPINGKLRAVLGFLEKLTLEPGRIVPNDIAPLRAAGLTTGAIEDAIQVSAIFNLIDRVADSLGFHVPGPEQFSRTAGMLLKRGYT